MPPCEDNAHQDSSSSSLPLWRDPDQDLAEDLAEDLMEDLMEDEGAARKDEVGITIESSTASSAGSSLSTLCTPLCGLRRRSISDPGRLASLLPGLGHGHCPGPGLDLLPGPGPHPGNASLMHSTDKIVDFLKFLN